MDIRFCDICNESVPQTDLDGGTAIIRNGRVVCANCEASMSPPEGSEGGLPDASSAANRPAPAAPFIGPAAGPIVASPPQRRERLLGVVLAGLMGTVALVVTSVVTLLLVERIEQSAADASRERGRLERGVTQEVARLESLLERWRAEDRALVQEELAAARDDASRARARMDERIAGLRGELSDLRDVLTRLEALEGRTGAQEAGLDAIESDLAQVKRDVGVLAERWMEAVAIGDVGPAAPAQADDTPEWLEATRGLESPNAATRWTAVTDLGKLEEPATVPYLVGMLTDPDIFVRTATARVLGDIGSSEAVPALIGALEDEERPVREVAISSLEKITGETLRYEPDAPSADRARRIRAWRDWWEKNSGA